MLSKTSIVIMSLLYREKLSAYDILRKIDEMNMRYWLPIGDTTLYETALRLEKKKFIEGTHSENTKVIYRITETGIAELRSSVCSLFCRIDYDTTWFSLATRFCRVLEDGVLHEMIKQRHMILDEYYKGTTEQYELLIMHHVPFQGICSIQRMIQVIELERESLASIERELG